MIKNLASLFILTLAAAYQESTPASSPAPPPSPCPGIFSYDSLDMDLNRWYGTINLITENDVHSLWLDILLDRKANLLGNWIGEVATKDNMEFKLTNTTFYIKPPMESIRFFVQYDHLKGSAPKLQRITFNGRDICDADSPRPAVENSLPRAKVTESPPEFSQKREKTVSNVRTVDKGYSEDEEEGPVYVPPVPPKNPSQYNLLPYSVNSSPPQQQNTNFRSIQQSSNVYQATTASPAPRKDIEEDDDEYSTNTGPKDYFSGILPTLIVSSNSKSVNLGRSSSNQIQCGTVIEKANPLVVKGKPTQEGQWPWHIALYQTQSVDNKYICGGTLVSNIHVITAAHCVTFLGSRRKVNMDTLTVYLGKHNLRTTVKGVQIRFVEKIILNREYNASTLIGDVAILKLGEPVTFSDTVRPACLWPDNLIDLENVIGKLGSVVGWGLDYTGVLTEDLFLVEMPVVDQETCLRSYDVFFSRHTSSKTFCAGHRDGSSACNGDSGGGMVFNIKDTWYLRGLVSISVKQKSEERCDPKNFVVFADLAQFLPWIKQKIEVQ